MCSHVIWAHQYDLRVSAILVCEHIDVNAPPRVVWKPLVDAEICRATFLSKIRLIVRPTRRAPGSNL